MQKHCDVKVKCVQSWRYSYDKKCRIFKRKSKIFIKKSGLAIQHILQNYMFERFLERLSKSVYKENFIIKGGCLLSSIMGIQNRTTMDIDANIIGIHFEKEEMQRIIEETIQLDLQDQIIFEISNVKDIKEGKKYTGYRFSLIGYFDKLKVPFHIDVSTGDTITPKAIHYHYKKLLEDGYIDILAYNAETILAKKLQTILELKIGNSRMKDYYDVYYLLHNDWDTLNVEILKEAIQITFTNRKAIEDLHRIEEILDALENESFLKKLWISYGEKHSYASNIKFNEIIKEIKSLASNLKISQL